MKKNTLSIKNVLDYVHNKKATYLFYRKNYRDVAIFIEEYPNLSEHKMEKLIKL